MLDPTISLAFSLHANPGGLRALAGFWHLTCRRDSDRLGSVVDLIEQVAQLSGEDTVGDPAGWYRQRFERDADYSVLLEELAAEPAERQRLLRSYFEPNDEDREQGRKTPTAAHTAIARLVRDGAVKERKSAARKARRKAAAPKCLTLADVLGRSTPLRGVGLRLDRPARDDQEAPIGATAKQVWPCRESARPSEAVPPATTGAGNVGSTSAAAARASA